MSHEPKPTPGTWRVEESLAPWIGVRDGNVWRRIVAESEWGDELVAEVSRTDNPTASEIEQEIANARLIAAAPDLLAALETVLERAIYFEEYLESDYPHFKPADVAEWEAQRDAAIAAIAKAKGEAQP